MALRSVFLVRRLEEHLRGWLAEIRSRTKPRDQMRAYARLVRTVEAPGEVPKSVAASDWQRIRAAHEAGRHAFQLIEGGWQARNPG